MDKNHNTDMINSFIIDHIGTETTKTTPIELLTLLKQKFNLKRKAFNLILNNLVSENILEYSNDYGRTFIEISYSKPVKISDHVIIKPPQIRYKNNPDEIVVTIETGTSFGRGTHPTTRLSINCIDTVLHKQRGCLSGKKALDIGTGSGILSLTGALFGIGYTDACDIDSVSLNEAVKNAKINNCEKKILFSDSFNGNIKYDFIFANLRFPTLIDLIPQISEMAKKDSYVIFSGIKVEEKEKVIQKYANENFQIINERSEKGWAAIILKKNDLKK